MKLKNLVQFVLIVFGIAFLPIITLAGDDLKVSDGCLAPIEKISFEDLKKLISEKKVVLLDCNGTESYTKGHIPSALNAKAEGVEKKLPADKKALIVSYCGSEKCTAWQDGAAKLSKLGYTNIKHFEGGLKGWQAAGGELEK